MSEITLCSSFRIILRRTVYADAQEELRQIDKILSVKSEVGFWDRHYMALDQEPCHKFAMLENRGLDQNNLFWIEEQMPNLQACILIYERHRQIEKWLKEYATLFECRQLAAAAHTLPVLNVEAKVGAEWCQTINSRKYSVPIQEALTRSAALYQAIVTLDGELRHEQKSVLQPVERPKQRPSYLRLIPTAPEAG